MSVKKDVVPCKFIYGKIRHTMAFVLMLFCISGIFFAPVVSAASTGSMDSSQYGWNPADSSGYDYQHAGQVPYNNVSLSWHFSNGFWHSDVFSNDLNNFVDSPVQATYASSAFPSSLDANNSVTVGPWTFSGGSGSGTGTGSGALLTLNTALQPSTTYTVKFKAGFTFNNGATLPQTYTYTFTTTAEAPSTAGSSSAAGGASPVVSAPSAGSSAAGQANAPASSAARTGTSVGNTSSAAGGSGGNAGSSSVSGAGVSSTAGSTVSSEISGSSSSVDSQALSSVADSTDAGTSSLTAENSTTVSANKENAYTTLTVVTVVLIALLALAVALRIGWARLKKQNSPAAARVAQKWNRLLERVRSFFKSKK